MSNINEVGNYNNYNYSNVKLVPQPRGLGVMLFPHQLSSIYKMEKMESNNYIEKDDFLKESKLGINADITGFGKTLSMIGLICRNKMPWNLETPFVFETIHTEAKGRIKNYFISRYDKLPCTLVLVSQTIVGQWINELKKTNLSYISVTNTRDLENLDINIIEKLDVIVVSSKIYNRLIGMYSEYCWKRFIFDEPGHLKIPEMKEVQAGFYWFVTATPTSITSMHRNCRNSFMKDIVGGAYYNDLDSHMNDITVKNDPEFVRQSFKMPQTRYYTHDCFQPILKAVSGFINSTITTMIKAGNIEGALTALGGRKTSNIFELVKNKKYEELEKIISKIKIYEIRKDTERIDEWTLKKVEIENKIKELDERIREILKSPCNICFEDLTNPILEPNCQNFFCGSCLLKWLSLKNTCPLCRHDISGKELIYFDNSKTESDECCEEESSKAPKRIPTKIPTAKIQNAIRPNQVSEN